MLSVNSFDELNIIVGYSRSMPFDKYFDEMEISEKQKEQRKAIASQFEEMLIFIAIYLFTMQQYGEVDWEALQIEIESRYTQVARNAGITERDAQYYAETFAQNYIDATQRHVDDLYYYSEDRARFNAENEANFVGNTTDFEAAVTSGKKYKQWVDIQDSRERKTHRKVGGTILPISEPFVVGNSQLQFPKDTSLGASADEIANCRCIARYF